ncbi:pantoate-beta-alanine ligase [Xylariales sp. AK1849]|nr:pantoate-beta-alanine ligase [Xylariales sp. AK1849]
MFCSSRSFPSPYNHSATMLAGAIRSVSSSRPFNAGLIARPMASSAGRTPRETIPSTPIRVLRTTDSIRLWRRPHLLDHRLVGLVPTMGALHQGHLSLIRAAAREAHHVVVSIYVNPAQFGVSEDLASYPVTWETDCRILAELDRELADDGGNLGRISAVFAPTTSEMYPSGFPGQQVDSKGSFVSLTPVSEVLEGASRPTFFRGVATVCMKLFNIVQPEKVYFGQKDVQQTVVIKKMIRDFMLPIDVEVGATIREPDGLALSSRNVYLGQRRRNIATVLSRALAAAEEQYLDGVLSRESILGAANQVAVDTLKEQMALTPENRVRFEVDYISLSDPETMQEVTEVDPKKGGILSGAIKLLPVEAPKPGEDLGHSGGPAVRLIDNIVLKPAA